MKKNNYTWDLEALLEDNTFEYLYNEWLEKQKVMLYLYPTFDKNQISFIKWNHLEEEYEILSNRVSNYISNNYNENITNKLWIGWQQKFTHDSHLFHMQVADLSNRIIKNETKIRKYLQSNELKPYQREYELIFKTKPHILAEKEQKLLTNMGIINSGFATIFSTLNDSEVRFNDAIDKNGKKIPLKTISDISINIKHKDRCVRQSTWINFNKAYSQYENTFTQTLYYNYLMLNTSSKIHHFKNYVEATAFADEIDEALILNLYKHTEKFKNIAIRYRNIVNKLLKKQLHLNKLEPWDKTVDLAKKDVQFTIRETQSIILKAFTPLGDEYVKNVKKAFSEGWISWLSKPGKQQGAYSIDGIKGLKKYYISMNFDKTIRSLSTIAHELGHSMNSLYVVRKQKIYTNVSIFYAEVSSIVNEMLLSYYLLDHYHNDKDMQKMILDELISNFFATVSRQIIFSHTEYVLNDFVNEGKPFTKEVVKSAYQDMIQKYMGFDKDVLAKLSKEPYKFSLSTILRIPHFYAGNFYVYKYAIGQIVAILVAQKIYNGDAQTLKRYFDFLSSGSSLSPIATIALLGIDLSKQNIYNEVEDVVSQWINKLENIAKKE